MRFLLIVANTPGPPVYTTLEQFGFRVFIFDGFSTSYCVTFSSGLHSFVSNIFNMSVNLRRHEQFLCDSYRPCLVRYMLLPAPSCEGELFSLGFGVGWAPRGAAQKMG
ncbi:hypothetical protein KC19_2G230800 [Ceratodon purpureus]|uniref:Uncharacterized protein n=1 Tax=Ceratodon purpureus TaxID=3225 RepID=A0A8T0IX14_CERPU|nr:hypothetical protein KC19_2G230800 [Ceratodon purpureus]